MGEGGVGSLNSQLPRNQLPIGSAEVGVGS
jgi:hypothetical protein